MTKLFLVFLFVPLLLINGCLNEENLTLGLDDEIYLVAEPSDLKELESVYKETFDQSIYTPHEEKIFSVRKVNVSNLEDHKNNKNIVFIAALNSDNPTSKFVKSFLDKKSIDDIRNRSTFYVRKEDLWAKDQVVLFIVAPEINDLKKLMVEHKDEIIAEYHKVADKRITKYMTENDEWQQKDLQEKFQSKYGWFMYVPKDFKVAVENEKENFVLLQCCPSKDFNRSIFIHWVDNASADYLNKDSLIKLRNNITARYEKEIFDNKKITVNDGSTSINEMILDEKYALLLQGIWDYENQKGGPFMSYAFFDENNNRLYLVDGFIYAPNYFKKRLIMQLDMMLRSFKVKK